MTHLLVIGFSKAIRGKGLSKINLLVKTPLHRRSMEVRRSGLWAPAETALISYAQGRYRIVRPLKYGKETEQLIFKF